MTTLLTLKGALIMDSTPKAFLIRTYENQAQLLLTGISKKKKNLHKINYIKTFNQLLVGKDCT